jgi:hypothetical protein
MHRREAEESMRSRASITPGLSQGRLYPTESPAQQQRSKPGQKAAVLSRVQGDTGTSLVHDDSGT